MARLSSILLMAGVACVLMLAAVPEPVAADECFGSGQWGSQGYGRTLVNWFCSNTFPPGEWSRCWNQPGSASVKWYLRARNGCGTNKYLPTQCSQAMHKAINCNPGNNFDTRGGKFWSTGATTCVEFVADPDGGRC